MEPDPSTFGSLLVARSLHRLPARAPITTPRPSNSRPGVGRVPCGSRWACGCKLGSERVGAELAASGYRVRLPARVEDRCGDRAPWYSARSVPDVERRSIMDAGGFAPRSRHQPQPGRTDDHRSWRRPAYAECRRGQDLAAVAPWRFAERRRRRPRIGSLHDLRRPSRRGAVPLE